MFRILISIFALNVTGLAPVADSTVEVLPEIIVTAPRLSVTDTATVGSLPPIRVEAARSLTPHTGKPAETKRTRDVRQMLPGIIPMAYAGEAPVLPALPKSMNLVECVPCETKGDFSVAPTETVKHDVAVSGGNADIAGMIVGDLTVMGGEVKIAGIIDGEVSVFGGNIVVSGEITEDVSLAGGTIRNQGRIGGDVAVAGGTVTLDSGSIVVGNISIVGGTVDRDTNAVVEGEILALDLGKLDEVFPKIGPFMRWRKGFSGWWGVVSSLLMVVAYAVLYALNLLISVIFPRAVDRIIEGTKTNFWIVLAIGVGIEILFIPIIILLAVSIIGIPLILLFPLAFVVAMLFGFSALAIVVGERVVAGFKWKVASRFGVFSIGWLTMMIILILTSFIRSLGFLGSLLWLLGAIIVYVGMTVGVGATLYALFRKRAA